MVALACTVDLHPALGHERVGDATHLYALQQLISEETAVERDFLLAFQTSVEDKHFDLYRDLNRLVGTWSQIELTRTLLELSIAASRSSDERYLRLTLCDQMAFVLWEIEEAQRDLEREAVPGDDVGRVRTSAAVRAFLSQAASAVARLQAEEQARPEIAIVPDER
jgi:hypothetical protein